MNPVERCKVWWRGGLDLDGGTTGPVRVRDDNGGMTGVTRLADWTERDWLRVTGNTSQRLAEKEGSTNGGKNPEMLLARTNWHLLSLFGYYNDSCVFNYVLFFIDECCFKLWFRFYMILYTDFRLTDRK